MGNRRRSHHIVIQIVIKGRAQAHFPHFRLSMEMNSLLFILALFGAAAAHGYDATTHSHSHGLADSNDSKQIVQEFITRIERSVNSKDVAAISNLFAHDSLFVGCHGSYNKTTMAAMLSRLPGDNFSFVLHSVKPLGNIMAFNTTVIGFERNPVLADFRMMKNEEKLAGGTIKSCKKPHPLNTNSNSFNI